MLFLKLVAKRSDCMNIIESTTDDRNTEIKKLFNKIKPFLDQGFSYNQAYEFALDKKPSTSRAWWRDLLQYGREQGYPKRYSEIANKYGLLNVQFSSKLKKWYYHYTVDGKRKYLTSYDLKKLRKRVENKGMPWVVLDMEVAQKSYEMNDKLLKERELEKRGRIGSGKPNKTGVLYVSRIKKKTYRNGFLWRYSNRKENVCISATTLRRLRKKVLELGYPWYILDKDKYQNYLDEENVRMHEN